MAEYISKTDAIHVSRYAAKTGKDVAGYIEHLPAADVVEVVHGEWIVDRAFGNDVMSGEQMVICSVCGKGIFWGKQKYCPNCGAKMDGGITHYKTTNANEFEEKQNERFDIS